MRTSANGNPLNHESGPFREVRQQDSQEGGRRVSGTGEGGHWSSWWDWSPGSNSLRRQDWSKRRNILTGTDVKGQDEEISQTGVLPAPLFLIYSIYVHYFDRNLINTIGRIRRMCLRYKSNALTLVKVELLVGAVPQTFDVHKVAVDIWIIQCAESHVCKSRGVSPSGLTLIYLLLWFPTRCLLFLDGHGQRRAVLHACGHNHLGGRHSDHRRCGGSGCRRRGYGCLLHSLFGWLGGNWDSAVLVQLPLHCALNLSSARDDSIRTCLQLNNGY